MELVIPSDGNSPPPWWVKAAYIFGVPSIIALALCWVMVIRFDASLKKIETDLSSQVKDVTAISEQNEEILSLMRLICSNTAENYQDKSRCFNFKSD